ncbi:signal peptidase I [Curtobacterium sp. TC1]|uniref:signal peptidase I n=1 Tax=Curtobacterium sp. TC1 TaxID=2862880 RepID=UPI001C9B4C72|nr:signal peptidase I [Curtobacterium sp. TC1]QZQ54446.1 signal peptidase I [Curtobacterium sp. TC1]
MTIIKRTLTLIYAAAILSFALAFTVGGYSVGHIMSGSMDPTIKTGDWIIQHKASAEDMKLGNIVTYTGHEKAMGHEFITHRIIGVVGDKAFTKGDANPVADPELITDEDLFAVVVWHFSLPFGN